MVFTDFVVPDLPYIAALAIAMIIIVVLVYAIQPPVTQPIILATVPWIINGAILHVFYQMHLVAPEGLFPSAIAPLFSAPSVYITTFVLLALVWLMGTMIVPSPQHHRKVAKYILIIGIGTLIPLFALLIWQGMGDAFELNPILPVLGLIISLVLTFVLFIAIGMWRTYIIAETRYVGALVIFGHVFDAVTTAIGVEILDAGERTLIPRMIMDFAADLPTADTLGEAWLFVLIKIVLAMAIVILFADYVRDKPAEGNLLLGIIAAVGLGPAVNNFLLFMLAV